MLILRSILFNIAFYVSMIVLMVVCSPMLLGDRRMVQQVARWWGQSSLWLLEKICGTRVEFLGLENVPKGAAMIAPKHQSMLETFAMVTVVGDFSYILKRELIWIPFFGWYLSRAGQTSINRATGAAALKEATRAGRVVTDAGRSLFIFPEGTRRPVDAPPRYKYGVGHLYEQLGVPCVPVALNTGLFWPRRKFLRKPGLCTIEFLPPIPPGLDRTAFVAELQERVETESNRLVAEALRADPSLAPPPHGIADVENPALKARS